MIAEKKDNNSQEEHQDPGDPEAYSPPVGFFFMKGIQGFVTEVDGVKERDTVKSVCAPVMIFPVVDILRRSASREWIIFRMKGRFGKDIISTDCPPAMSVCEFHQPTFSPEIMYAGYFGGGDWELTVIRLFCFEGLFGDP
jgi:hypothetical protein